MPGGFLAGGDVRGFPKRFALIIRDCYVMSTRDAETYTLQAGREGAPNPRYTAEALYAERHFVVVRVPTVVVVRRIAPGADTRALRAVYGAQAVELLLQRSARLPPERRPTTESRPSQALRVHRAGKDVLHVTTVIATRSQARRDGRLGGTISVASAA